MSRSWYVLGTFSGYEQKIERSIKSLLESGDLDSNVIVNICVPMEEVTEVKEVTAKNGEKKKKTVVKKVKLLAGYILLEMDLPETGWKETCLKLYRIRGVSGFIGCLSRNDRPVPLSKDEAINLLQKSGVIKGEKPARINHSFNVGDEVKITDGAFATFSAVIKEINLEKEKLNVEVQIFGRSTPVEVSFLQVEKA